MYFLKYKGLADLCKKYWRIIRVGTHSLFNMANFEKGNSSFRFIFVFLKLCEQYEMV